MGHRVLHLTEVESTNRYALERFAELPHGLAVVADRQTRGRGRSDRAWHSSVAGNLYASLVLKSEPDTGERLPAAFVNLTQYMAVVLARIVARLGAEVAIKWPNDLLADGRKLAGILGEAVNSSGHVAGVVLGTGVNLAMGPEELAAIDQPATSLNLLVGRPVERDVFLHALLEEFFAGYGGFMESGFPSIRSEYLARTPFLGRPISVNSVNSRITGTACDITEEGSLVVLTPHGRVKLTLGDVQ